MSNKPARLPCPHCGQTETLETLADERAALEADWRNLQERLKPGSTHDYGSVAIGSGAQASQNIAIGLNAVAKPYPIGLDGRVSLVWESGQWVPSRNYVNVPVEGQEACLTCGTVYCPIVSEFAKSIRARIEELQRKMVLDLMAKAATDGEV